MGTTTQLMNKPMWFFAALLIVWVLVQTGMFLKLAMGFNKKNNLMTQDEIKACVKSGSIAVIGPAINAIAVCLALITMMGSADTFMRCGVIGAPAQELYLAQTAAVVSGVEFGGPDFTPAVYAFCVFLQGWGAIPFFLHTCISLKPLDLAVEKTKKTAVKGGPQFTSYLGEAAMFSVMTFFLANYVSAGLAGVASVVAAIAMSVILFFVIKKTGSKKLGSYSMVISMVAAMIAGEIVNGMVA